MGAGEPMRVGELVAIDGFDVVKAWARAGADASESGSVSEFDSEGRFCRFLLEE